MAKSGDPAHYIVFHPECKRIDASVRATALVCGQRVNSWTGKVWMDRPPGNEDPFVLGRSWAYSYCHATELRRKLRKDGGYVRKGSCILFCSGDDAMPTHAMLTIDTVFYVAEAHYWQSAKVPT